MKERCIFPKIDFRNPNLPSFRGPRGECYANCGKGMRNCCFEAGNRLFDIGEGLAVRIAYEDLRMHDNLSANSKRRGLEAAIDKHTSAPRLVPESVG